MVTLWDDCTLYLSVLNRILSNFWSKIFQFNLHKNVYSSIPQGAEIFNMMDTIVGSPFQNNIGFWKSVLCSTTVRNGGARCHHKQHPPDNRLGARQEHVGLARRRSPRPGCLNELRQATQPTRSYKEPCRNCSTVLSVHRFPLSFGIVYITTLLMSARPSYVWTSEDDLSHWNFETSQNKVVVLEILC